MAYEHRTVLLDATLEHLQVRPGGRWLDGTLGGGGHAQGLLERCAPDGQVWGIDRDPAALAAAGARLSEYGDRVHLVHGAFADMGALVQGPLDGVVLDLGVSSPQLDHGERGFSFMRDGPVDMRMDPTQPLDAAGLLEQLDEDGLVDILRRFGEEPRARRIARAVLAGRPWTSTVALADCVERASNWRGSRVHPATRTFQALRIAVNDELGQLERGLQAAFGLLGPGGRLAVISFQSLEDRIVKHAFRRLAGVGAPRDAFGQPVTPPAARVIQRRGVTGAAADPDNPRARSARLRVLERVQAEVVVDAPGSSGPVSSQS